MSSLRSGVETMLAQVGVARQDDLEEIQEEVEELSHTIDRLAEAAGASSGEKASTLEGV